MSPSLLLLLVIYECTYSSVHVPILYYCLIEQGRHGQSIRGHKIQGIVWKRKLWGSWYTQPPPLNPCFPCFLYTIFVHVYAQVCHLAFVAFWLTLPPLWAHTSCTSDTSFLPDPASPCSGCKVLYQHTIVVSIATSLAHPLPGCCLYLPAYKHSSTTSQAHVPTKMVTFFQT